MNAITRIDAATTSIEIERIVEQTYPELPNMDYTEAAWCAAEEGDLERAAFFRQCSIRWNDLFSGETK